MRQVKQRQDQFLSALIDSSGNKTKAGSLANVPKSTYARWFNSDDDFKNRIAEIFPKIERELLEEAINRAMTKSDVLLIFLLKSLNPCRYDDAVRKQILLEKETKTIEVQIPKSNEEIKKLIAELIEIDPYGDYGQIG